MMTNTGVATARSIFFIPSTKWRLAMKYVTTLFLLSVCVAGFAQTSAPDLKKAAVKSATALIRPSGLYSDQLGIQSRKKLKAELKELRIQMG